MSREQTRALTLLELLIVIALISVLLVISVPNLLASKRAANEANAIRGLRILVSAEENYRSRQPNPHYGTLKELNDLGILDKELGTASDPQHAWNGYYFVQKEKASSDTYAFTAQAGVQGETGDRSFFVDQTGVIRQDKKGPNATAASPPI